MNRKKIKSIHIIINPTSGRIEPILPVMNSIFKDSGIEWDISITKHAGDGQLLAREAIKKGFDAVGVYGGDGTIMEVVTALIGSNVPLAIFPGGTANVTAGELQIPKNLREACELFCQGGMEVQSIDVGKFNKRYFLLRASLGFEAEMIKGASREIKHRFGRLAYAISAFKSLRKMKKYKYTKYAIHIDGQEHEVEGFCCLIANSGNVGWAHLTVDKSINMSDGLLDVIVVRKATIGSWRHLIATLIKQELPRDVELVCHWQGKEITIVASPTQNVQCDGESLEMQTITAKVIPGAIQIFVPLKRQKD
jgi:diacylglycerol kinase (ATP)